MTGIHGVGANSRHFLKTAVFGGLLVPTFLSLLIVPVLYVIIKNLAAQFFVKKPRSNHQKSALDGTGKPEPQQVSRDR